MRSVPASSRSRPASWNSGPTRSPCCPKPTRAASSSRPPSWTRSCPRSAATRTKASSPRCSRPAASATSSGCARSSRRAPCSNAFAPTSPARSRSRKRSSVMRSRLAPNRRMSPSRTSARSSPSRSGSSWCSSDSRRSRTPPIRRRSPTGCRTPPPRQLLPRPPPPTPIPPRRRLRKRRRKRTATSAHLDDPPSDRTQAPREHPWRLRGSARWRREGGRHLQPSAAASLPGMRRFLASTLAFVVAQVQTSDDPVVVRLGSQTETLSEFEDRFEIAIRSVVASQGAQMTEEIRTQLTSLAPAYLDQRAQEIVLLAEAEERGVVVDDEAVDARVVLESGPDLRDDAAFEQLLAE